jgi:peptidoglycan/LPS O-acetylase OafA/YrhL
MAPAKGNLESVNVARGIAALSVFVYHYGVGPVIAKYTGITQFNWISIPGASYGVTLFFVISGFCIHGSEWRRLQKNSATLSVGQYFERRIRRIYPLYSVTLLLSCLLNWVQSKPLSAADVISHAFLLHGFSRDYFNSINLVLWTISIEACFYLIYPAWLILRLRVGLGRAFIYGSVISVASCVFTAVYLYPYGLPSRWFFLNVWGGWLLGAWMAEALETEPCIFRNWRWWLAGVVFWILGLCAEAADFYRGHWLLLQFPVRIYLCAWPLSALVINEHRLDRCRGLAGLFINWLSAIGLASYSLYLLHEPLIGVRNLVQDFVNFGQFKLLFQVTWFFVILGISWLSYHFLELRFIKSSPKLKNS